MHSFFNTVIPSLSGELFFNFIFVSFESRKGYTFEIPPSEMETNIRHGGGRVRSFKNVFPYVSAGLFSLQPTFTLKPFFLIPTSPVDGFFPPGPRNRPGMKCPRVQEQARRTKTTMTFTKSKRMK